MPTESISTLKKKDSNTFVLICVEKFNDLLICHETYSLKKSDISLFLHLCLESCNNSLSTKISESLLSSLFDLKIETIHSSLLRLRYADLIRQREHSFMINPDYVKFGRKQIQALQRINWGKIKPHSKAKTHSIENIQLSNKSHSL